MTSQYSMVIRWSEEDQVFVVSLPEFGPSAQTHGDTYEKAARSGRQVLDLLIESFQADGQRLPDPFLYGSVAVPHEMLTGLAAEELAKEKE